MKAIRVHECGGPEVLRYEDVPVPEPKKGEAKVRIEFAGINYIDIYNRSGLYPLPTPFTPGMEGSGVVDALGSDVSEVKKGDRVAYAMHAGSYAQYAVVPAASLVRIPDKLTFEQGAAAMLQGMTAHYLAKSTYPVKKGDRVLVHAAAGGVGLLLVQVAKQLGATVFGTVSTEEKASLAREAGADHTILYTRSDFEEEIKKATGDAGVDVVYDSVGKTTFEKSLNCLKPRGFLVSYGQSSGPMAPFDTSVLLAKGSLYLTRPALWHYTRDRSELLERAGDVFDWIMKGTLKLRIDTVPLSLASKAHALLEGRKTAGKLLLIAGK
jgi:NADPH2:quinone reductase